MRVLVGPLALLADRVLQGGAQQQRLIARPHLSKKCQCEMLFMLRHIEVMVDEDLTLPHGFRKALKFKMHVVEFKMLPVLCFEPKDVAPAELRLPPYTTLYKKTIHRKMEPLLSPVPQLFDLDRLDYAFQRYEKTLEYLEVAEEMDADEKRQAQGRDGAGAILSRATPAHLWLRCCVYIS